jgi:hypothetical protein
MLCKCGCGAETSLAKRTDPRYGTVEGQPLNYVTGHHNTKRKLPVEEAARRLAISRKTWRSRNPNETRKMRLKHMGWTEESIAAAKEAQSECCALCQETKTLVPDHKHSKPPVPRALLCFSCNVAIGMLKDSPERCEAAAAYLRKFLRTPWRGPVLCG